MYTPRWTVTNGTCIVFDDVQIQLNRIPDVLSTPSAQAICNGSTTSLVITNPNAVAGTTYTWISTLFSGTASGFSNGSGATISQPLTTNNLGGVVRYTITPSANGCNGSSINVDVTVNPVPDASVSNSVICRGTSTNISISNPNAVAGTKYTWTVAQSNVSGAADQVAPVSGPIVQSLTATTNAPGTATYTITPVSPSGCTGTPVISTVTVNPIPDALASNQIICSGQTTSVAISNPNNVSGTAFNWIVQSSSNVTGVNTGNGTSINQQLSSTDGINSGSVTYAITPVANGCSGSTITVTVTVNPVPVITDTATQLQTTICSGTALNFTPTSTIGTTSYTWTSTVSGTITAGVSASGSSTITDSPVNTGNVAGTVTYRITPSVGSCNGLARDYVVTVQPVPSANGTDVTICSGQNAVITINSSPQNVSGTTFSWIVIPTGNITGASAGNGSTINQTLSLTDYNIGSVIYGITPRMCWPNQRYTSNS